MGPASREEVSTSDQLSVAQRLSSRLKPVPRCRVSIEFAGFLTDRLRSVVGRNGAIPTVSYTKFVTNPKGRSVSLEGLFREDSNPLRLHDSATRLRPATEASVVGCESPGCDKGRISLPISYGSYVQADFGLAGSSFTGFSPCS